MKKYKVTLCGALKHVITVEALDLEKAQIALKTYCTLHKIDLNRFDIVSFEVV